MPEDTFPHFYNTMSYMEFIETTFIPKYESGPWSSIEIFDMLEQLQNIQDCETESGMANRFHRLYCVVYGWSKGFIERFEDISLIFPENYQNITIRRWVESEVIDMANMCRIKMNTVDEWPFWWAVFFMTMQMSQEFGKCIWEFYIDDVASFFGDENVETLYCRSKILIQNLYVTFEDIPEECHPYEILERLDGNTSIHSEIGDVCENALLHM